jgi:hypothetical protein
MYFFLHYLGDVSKNKSSTRSKNGTFDPNTVFHLFKFFFFFFLLAFTHDTHWSHEKNSKQVSTFKKAFWPHALLDLGPYSTPPYTSPYSSNLLTFMLCNFA